MSANAVSGATIDTPASPRTGSLKLISWIGSLAVAAILGMGAAPKFFNYTPEGSMALAQGLGVGRAVVTLIGGVETVALLLILLPRTRALGAAIAAGTMAGALFSHVTVLGFSGNAAAEMWPLALSALVAAAVVAWIHRSELPVIGTGR